MSTRTLSIQNTEIRTIYDLLDLIRVRPGIWVGEPSITRLSIFIHGFTVGVYAADASLDDGTPPFQEFHEWVARSLNRRKNGHGWSSMLLESCAGDESRAFECFWKELDAFRTQSNVK